MKTFVIAIALAILTLSAPALATPGPAVSTGHVAVQAGGAPAERCRMQRGPKRGKLAKCSKRGAVPVSRYVRKCTEDGTPCKVRQPRKPKGL